ncbi:MAG: DUF2157 domain-containing protein [Acidimicrobiia bacterium]
MVSIAALVIVIVVIVVAARGRGTRPLPPAIAAATPGRLAAWVQAGLITAEQATAIAAFETPRPVEPATARSSRPRERRFAIGETFGYIGGLLTALGAVLLVAHYWPDMATAGRLTLTGAAAAALFLAGALLPEKKHTPTQRLRWFLWTVASACAGSFAGVVTDSNGAGRPAVVLSVSATIAATSTLLWARRDRPVQQFAALAAAVVALGTATAMQLSTGAAGVVVWLAGASCIVAARLGWVHRRDVFVIGGAPTVVVGAVLTSAAWEGPGMLFALFTALGLVAIALVETLSPHRIDVTVYGAVGAAATVLTLPQALGWFARDAGAATGTALATAGALAALAGARRLTRLEHVVEALGLVATVGGVALTAAQWPGAAPLLGTIAAVALFAIGTRPGRVFESLAGAVALLVNVPWAVGRYFPGEGRVPVILVITGALLVAIAVWLSRTSGRMRGGFTG